MQCEKWIVCGVLIGLISCTTFVPAPGASEVRVANKPADVVDCTPVGNIQVPRDANGLVDVAHTLDQLKNQTVGLGGNTALITQREQSIPAAGIAYRCPSQAASGT
jgi:hypothetical protein